MDMEKNKYNKRVIRFLSGCQYWMSGGMLPILLIVADTILALLRTQGSRWEGRTGSARR